MPATIHREEVQQLIADSAQVVEVLPEKEYAEEHLPDAISIPLGELDERSAGRLDKKAPVVVYCYDDQCDMSPRAASVLERMGFTKVYDYVDGKVDWFAAGLPREGKLEAYSRTGHLARRDVPTCGPDERVNDVARRVDNAGWDACVVVDDDRVVLGLLDEEAIKSGGDTTAEEVMRSGPSTYRPNVLLDEIVDHLRERDVHRALVSTSDGRLVGMLFRSDAERVLSGEGSPK